MRLTLHTDYALRVLLYLASAPERVVPVGELAGAYAISKNHLAKVVQSLRDRGHVETVRGARGGLRLARAPETIVIGQVVRETEPDFDLVDCLQASDAKCVLRGACALESALGAARGAFLEALDGYTLADVSSNRRTLMGRLGLGP